MPAAGQCLDICPFQNAPPGVDALAVVDMNHSSDRFGAAGGTVPVCDRFSSCRALAGTLDLVPAFCRSHCRRNLAGRDPDAPEAKIVRSLRNHRQGPEVFVSDPAISMDDNASERGLRGPAIARKLAFGSDPVRGTMIHSLFATLERGRIDSVRWLDAGAEGGGQPP